MNELLPDSTGYADEVMGMIVAMPDAPTAEPIIDLDTDPDQQQAEPLSDSEIQSICSNWLR